MSYCLSESDRLNLMMPAIDYLSGLPDDVIQVVMDALPNISGLVSGMSVKDFEAILELESSVAKKEFVKEYGEAFGDRRSDSSPLRYKQVQNPSVGSAPIGEEVASSMHKGGSSFLQYA